MARENATSTSTSSLDFCCLGLGGLIMLMLILVPVSIEPNVTDAGEDQEVPFDYEVDVVIDLPVVCGDSPVLVKHGKWDDPTSLEETLERYFQDQGLLEDDSSTITGFPVTGEADLPSFIITEIAPISIRLTSAGQSEVLVLSPDNRAESKDFRDSRLNASYEARDTNYSYECERAIYTEFYFRHHKINTHIQIPSTADISDGTLTCSFSLWGFATYATKTVDFQCIPSDSVERSRRAVFFRVSSEVLPSESPRSVICTSGAEWLGEFVALDVKIDTDFALALDPATDSQVLVCEGIDAKCVTKARCVAGAD